MEEIALHVLDIAMNAIAAGARNLVIAVEEDVLHDRLAVQVRDDGRGMDAEHLRKVRIGFVSERSGRRRPIGLGLALLAQTAEMCGGEIRVTSEPGQGTQIEAWMQHGHIDRPPLGDLGGTVFALCVGAPQVHLQFTHRRGDGETHFDSAEVHRTLKAGSVLQSPEGVRAVRQALGSQA